MPAAIGLSRCRSDRLSRFQFRHRPGARLTLSSGEIAPVTEYSERLISLLASPHRAGSCTAWTSPATSASSYAVETSGGAHHRLTPNDNTLFTNRARSAMPEMR
ncbi:MAG: hypothetical protein R2845_04845 [Thermomicrobiales bacterium]